MVLSLDIINGRALNGQKLSSEEALAVLNCSDAKLDDLYQAVSALRRTYRGRQVAIQVITSLKNGDCGEDCRYCAQSRDSKAGVPKYNLIDAEYLRQKARLGARGRVTRHCLAFSGLRFTDDEIETFSQRIELVKKEADTPICLSIGLLTRSQALRLKEAGVSRINHNLNSSARYYPSICSTHTWEERLENLWTLKSVGLELCCGGIVGLGEEKSDVVDMLMAIRSLEPASVPINFYVPIEGTALAALGVAPLSPEYCLKVLGLARLTLPKAEIRCAAGREKYLSQKTEYVLAAADSIFASGYLTVDGLGLEPTVAEVEKAGYEVVWG
ncbi:MAG: biotin synthase BioB [Deltaproteobacteria bacterium]|jgi:biotin synthase|nr:biotin synthase BioB [Deltaproteobacteria bacterium]